MNLNPRPRLRIGDSTASALCWCAIVVLLVSNVPLFLCTRLADDATYYDLQLRCITNGGVLYRDMLEPNLPGVVWIHYLVRSVGGWSSAALRAFDLLALGTIVSMLAAITCQNGLRKSLSPVFILAACLFYLSAPAWDHCQRDLWMLLPALAALCLRAWSIRSLTTATLGALTRLALAEGILWGIAFWIKPHVAVPALALSLASLVLTGWSRRAAANAAGVFTGGLLVGGAGCCWLIAGDAWPHFWEMQLGWNPEYLAARRHWDLRGRCLELFGGFVPWSYLHAIAIPRAALDLARYRRFLGRVPRATSNPDRYQFLLAAMYLGWLVQATCLQQGFSYVQVPAVLLAMALTVGSPWPSRFALARRGVLATVFTIALLTSPCWKLARLHCWAACLARGPTIEMRPKLQTWEGRFWEDYPALVEFLRNQELGDRDVSVYQSWLLSLYPDLGLRPPHRFVLTDLHRSFFPSRSREIDDAMQRSPHRFVISDLRAYGLTAEQLGDDSRLPVQLPASLSAQYPFTLPIIFRSGTFCVHERVNSE